MFWYKVFCELHLTYIYIYLLSNILKIHENQKTCMQILTLSYHKGNLHDDLQ